ncbi:Serine/threonine-protein kinase, active site [Sesbania bispinosa]|nr:Serine/threonine-protein kinase, active site [Sesbania bispinosa]
MVKWLKIKVIGSGSYGTVYEAINSSPEKDSLKSIAIKSAPLSKSYELHREWQILNSFLCAPEIVQSHGSSNVTMEDGKWVYNLHLEYAPFGTLTDMIKKGRFLESRTTKVYMNMLLQGLSRIHKKGFVHCDLKPDNILTPEEKVNQEDWKWRCRGTPLFMSPESISCGQIEAPLDIWSFGCIVLEMLTGYPAWRDGMKTEEDVMLRLECANGVVEKTYWCWCCYRLVAVLWFFYSTWLRPRQVGVMGGSFFQNSDSSDSFTSDDSERVRELHKSPSPDADLERGNHDANGNTITVLKLQVAMFGGMGSSIQRDLTRIAEAADTSSPEGVSNLLTETILTLDRHPGYCIAGYSSVDLKRSKEDGGEML